MVATDIPEEGKMGESGYQDKDDELQKLVPTQKAYKNLDFLNSPEARMIRIQCELEEPKHRLKKEGVDNIVMFFGSARAKNQTDFNANIAKIQKEVDENPALAPQLERAKKQEFLVKYYNDTTALAKKFSEWSKKRMESGKEGYYVASGGGPGMMKAANKGAHEAGAKSVGFGISVPFEDGLNPYVTPELGFEFHYFFTRKFWMAYKVMGLVVCPGGLGTLDEMFELMTLMQTGKIKRKIPIILIGKDYWDKVIDFQVMADYGMIAQNDVDGIYKTDSVLFSNKFNFERQNHSFDIRIFIQNSFCRK